MREASAEGFARFRRSQSNATDQATDPIDRIRRRGRAYLDFALARPSLFRVLFLDRPVPGQPPANVSDPGQDLTDLTADVTAAIAAGRLAPPTPSSSPSACGRPFTASPRCGSPPPSYRTAWPDGSPPHRPTPSSPATHLASSPPPLAHRIEMKVGLWSPARGVYTALPLGCPTEHGRGVVSLTALARSVGRYGSTRSPRR